MRSLLWVGAFLLWTVVVCAGTFRATFPSEVVADRIRYEVPLRIGRTWSADIGDVRPWWLGVSVDDVMLFHESATVPTRSPIRPPGMPGLPGAAGEFADEESDPEAEAGDGPHLAAALSNVRIRLSPWSLVRRAPWVTAAVSFGDDVAWTQVGTTVGARGEVHITDLAISGAVPLAEVLALALDGASGDGVLDLDIDLAGGEHGMRDSSGRASVKGARLVLSDLEITGVGPLGMEVPISALNLTADVVNGKATVTDGRVVTDLATIEIDGEITLRDPLDRSSYDLQFVISDLSPEVAAFQTMMASAKQSNGTFLYSCRGTLSRPTASGCTSRARSATARPPSTPRTSVTGTTLTDEEREARKKEIRDRLQKEREEQQASGRAPVATPGEPEQGGSEEDEAIDEIPLDGSEDDPDLDGEEIPPGE